MNPAEAYILNQEDPYRSMLMHLQGVIERELVDVDLKFKYKIPFYYIAGRPFCYLNRGKDYIDVGFWNAAHLTVYQEHLVSAGRKVMRSLRYRSLEEINHTVLVGVLQDAYAVRDKKFWK